MDHVLRTETRGISLGYLAPAMIGLFIAIGVLVQWTTHLNHDVAWVLYSTGKMLDGAVYGRDIIEPNPPLVWFLTMPAAAVARLFGQDPIAVFRLFVVGVALVPLAHAYLTLRSGRAACAPAETATLIVVLAYVLFVGCYRDFGQREYLSLRPGTGGVFEVQVDGTTVWSRKAEGCFPDIKELKQRVRDRIAPDKPLGHSDKPAV